MNKIKFLSITIFVLVFLMYGCKKDETVVIDSQTTSSKDNGVAESLFADIKKVVEEAADDEGQSNKGIVGGVKSGNYSFGSCATVSIAPAWADTTFPKVMTIDFGAANCTGAYGVNRRGQLVVTLTDRYRNLGSILTVQPQNYFVNDVKVEGTKTITNLGYNANNNLEYQVEIVNGVLTYPDGTVTSWASTRNNEWIEGDSTTFFTNGLAGVCDDVYLITGNSSGVNRNGLAYTVNILASSPLRKEVCCRWIVSGTLELIPSGLATRTVDFGSGACDAQATIAINGNTYYLQMY